MDKTTTLRLRTALLATATAALTACGGGGSDGGDTLPTSGSYTITTASATTLTEDLADSINVLDSAYGLGFDMALSVADVSTTGSQRRVSSLHGLLNGPRIKRIASVGRQIAATTATDTVACDASGSATVRLVDQNGNGSFDANDSATITFSACRNGDGMQIDGALGLTYNSSTSYNAATGGYALDASLRFTQLTVTELSSTQSAVLDGDLRFVSRFTTSTAGQDTISGASFTAGVRVNGVQASSRTLSQLSWNIVTDSAGTSVSDLSTQVTSDMLGGRSVVLTTPTALRSLASDVYPSSGEIRLTGANGARMTLTALNASQVRRDIDTNGDGTAEASSVLAWSTVLPTD